MRPGSYIHATPHLARVPASAAWRVSAGARPTCFLGLLAPSQGQPDHALAAGPGKAMSPRRRTGQGRETAPATGSYRKIGPAGRISHSCATASPRPRCRPRAVRARMKISSCAWDWISSWLTRNQAGVNWEKSWRELGEDQPGSDAGGNPAAQALQVRPGQAGSPGEDLWRRRDGQGGTRGSGLGIPVIRTVGAYPLRQRLPGRHRPGLLDADGLHRPVHREGTRQVFPQQARDRPGRLPGRPAHRSGHAPARASRGPALPFTLVTYLTERPPRSEHRASSAWPGTGRSVRGRTVLR
jgi:hypothetical protein